MSGDLRRRLAKLETAAARIAYPYQLPDGMTLAEAAALWAATIALDFSAAPIDDDPNRITLNDSFATASEKWTAALRAKSPGVDRGLQWRELA